MTSDSVHDARPKRASTDPWLGDVGFHVGRRVDQLYRERERSTAVATFARLRANAGREPGDDPLLWAVTLEEAPGSPRDDAPTFQERAIHTALTLYALHQQSKDQSMHYPGTGFGVAVARLDRARPGAGDGVSPVRRRFNAVATATSLGEMTQHLRGLVAQMRGEGIALDYGALADDLFQFQLPGGASIVRRRWGRQLYHLQSQPTSSDAEPTQPELTEENR